MKIWTLAAAVSAAAAIVHVINVSRREGYADGVTAGYRRAAASAPLLTGGEQR